ncbi:MAG TPA: YihY/virulence factor BrkB family protein [Methanothrix sp.]|nr:YihY/virulence factor BrkB family protein [Methanothrix sp.]
MYLKASSQILRKAFSEWLKDDASLLAAALAYYGLFSFVPLIILLLTFLNSLFRQGYLDSQTVEQSLDLVGQQMPAGTDGLIDQASDRAASFGFTVISILILLFGAAGLFVQTKRAFDIIWDLPENGRPLLETALSYLHSYLLIALAAFLLLATSAANAILLPVAGLIEEFLPVHLGLLRLVTFLVSFLFVTILFAAAYKTLIEVHLTWWQVVPGSALASFLFAAGNLCIEAYVGLVDVGSAYGAAGSLVVFLFWIYYSAQIFLFGAEVVKVQKRHAEQYNKHLSANTDN